MLCEKWCPTLQTSYVSLLPFSPRFIWTGTIERTLHHWGRSATVIKLRLFVTVELRDGVRATLWTLSNKSSLTCALFRAGRLCVGGRLFFLVWEDFIPGQTSQNRSEMCVRCAHIWDCVCMDLTGSFDVLTVICSHFCCESHQLGDIQLCATGFVLYSTTLTSQTGAYVMLHSHQACVTCSSTRWMRVLVHTFSIWYSHCTVATQY